MAIQLECPGCKAILQVDDSLLGKTGKCIHCGHRIHVVPGGVSSPGPGSSGPRISNSPPPPPPPPAATSTPPAAVPPPRPASSTTMAPKVDAPLSPPLFEATPESMLRELGARGQSAVLFLFQPTSDGSYDLGDIPESDLKCIVTDDISMPRFAQFAASLPKKFGARKKGPPSSEIPLEQLLFELKGDRLGMTLDEFKKKYAGGGEGGRDRLPLCSDEAWGPNKAALHVEPWHQKAGIVHARIDLPAENNSPTIAGVKSDLLLYQFIDGRLYRITALLPSHQFHVIHGAVLNKYGQHTSETQKSQQYVWDNPIASVILTKGTFHPPVPSRLEVVYKALAQMAESRAPTGAGDI